MKVLIRGIVSILVFTTDVIYRDRPYPRFYLSVKTVVVTLKEIPLCP